jgi:hypothetical protein
MRRQNMNIIHLAILLICAQTLAAPVLSQDAVPSQVKALFDSCVPHPVFWTQDRLDHAAS